MSKNPQIKFNKIIIKSLNKDFEDYLNKKEKLVFTGFTVPVLLKYQKQIIEIMFLYLYDNRPLYIGILEGKILQ